LFKFELNPNFKLDNKAPLKHLEAETTKIILNRGCSMCKSNNLEVTITKTTPSRISAHYHCNNCQANEDVAINHDLDEKLRDFENKMKNVFK
jgi:hypothetical protein